MAAKKPSTTSKRKAKGTSKTANSTKAAGRSARTTVLDPPIDKDWAIRYRGGCEPRREGPEANLGKPIWHLARLAKTDAAFRRELTVIENFRERFIRELATKPDKLEPLSEDEIAFCQGWLYLIHSTPPANGQSKDAQILQAIQRHLGPEGFGTSGISG